MKVLILVELGKVGGKWGIGLVRWNLDMMMGRNVEFDRVRGDWNGKFDGEVVE